MDDYEEVTELPNARRVVFVTSTMGQGGPPRERQALLAVPPPQEPPLGLPLSRLAFACFGLGDSHYQKYNVVAKKLAKRLCNLGARPILDLGLGDDQHPSGHEAALDPGLPSCGPNSTSSAPEAQVSLASERYHHHDEELSKNLIHRSGKTSSFATSIRADSRWRRSAPTESESTPACASGRRPVFARVPVRRRRRTDRVARAADPVDPKLLRGGVVGGAAAAASANASPRGFGNHAVATVTRNDPLTASDAVTETRHIELTLENLDRNHHHRRGGSCSFAYEPGDSLAVVPRGCGGASSEDEWSRGVDEVLRRRCVARRRRRGATGVDSSGFFESGIAFRPRAYSRERWWRARWTWRPRRRVGTFSEVASRYATDADERERLAHFASAAGRDELYRYNQRERRTVLEFLSDFPSVAMPLEWVLQTAPRLLRPRLFLLVSSSPETDGDATHLTVSSRDGRRITGENASVYVRARSRERLRRGRVSRRGSSREDFERHRATRRRSWRCARGRRRASI